MGAFFRPASLVAISAVLFVFANAAFAQIAEDRPRFVLDPGGPAGVVRDLAFSADSTRLYSGGDDKVVHAWAIRDLGALVRRYDAVLAQTLRWEISRGLRGVVHALASAPGGRRLAIGGFSARIPNGTIVLYDTATATVERALQGHPTTVTALAFSADGNRLASISTDNEVRIWSAPAWNSQVLVPAQKDLLPHARLAFVAGPLDLAVSWSSPNGWYVVLYDSTGRNPPRTLPQLHAEALTALAADPHGPAWASADAAGNVFVWDGVRNEAPRRLRQGLVALDLAFAPEARLFVATKGGPDQPGTLEHWDVATGKRLESLDVARGRNDAPEHNFAVAVSPDGKWVATGGDEEIPLQVFPLTDAKGIRLPAPLAGRPFKLLGGGARIGKVAFAADPQRPYRLGFGPIDPGQRNAFDYGRVVQEFDPVAGVLKDRNAPGAREFVDSQVAPGWSVRSDDGWQVVVTGPGRAVPIQLDRVQQGRLRSFAWLRDNAGPFAIALGTDLQNGIYVYRLDGAPSLVRYFRDHNNWVTSLSISLDGRFLATGSADQSIKFWSLEGLENRQALAQGLASGFAAAPGWGATLRLRGNQVEVASVLKPGIAATRDLRVGDVIAAVEFNTNGGRAARQVRGNSPEIFRILETSPLTQTLVLDVVRNGQPLAGRILLVPAWEPLMTLFTNQRGEWVLASPQGYYDASTSGDELVGWHINRGIDRTPDFFKAEQFRHELERPEVLRNLLTFRSLPDAVAGAGGQRKPAPPLTTLVENAPQIVLQNPTDNAQFNAGLVPISARVKFASQQDSNRFRVTAYVNGSIARQTGTQVVGLERTTTWSIQPFERNNSVVILADASESGATEFNYKTVHFRAQPGPTQPRLHVLALAANEYHGLPRLNAPVADADGVIRQLTQAGLYAPGRVEKLYEDKLTTIALQAAIARLKDAIKEDSSGDLLVVFVAGHGEEVNETFYFLPPDRRFAAAFGNKAVMDRAIVDHGISWRHLEPLDAIPCRKVLLLDACHSGSLLSQMKAAVRPRKQQQMLVITATSVGQLALELPKDKNGVTHGAFTQKLLDGLANQADKEPKDGHVDFREAFDYIDREVPRLVSLYQSEQRPQAAPKMLFEAMGVVPLVKYRASE